jgi:hypothetical protein
MNLKILPIQSLTQHAVRHLDNAHHLKMPSTTVRIRTLRPTVQIINNTWLKADSKLLGNNLNRLTAPWISP